MAAMNSVEYNLRTLPTTSITLFPARAQIFRKVEDVPLQRGTNEVTIVGLSPTTDEHSIKVEGSGEATISNITVEKLANKELYDNVYPDEDENVSSDDEDDTEDEDEEENADLKAAEAERQQILDQKDLIAHRISCLQHNNGALDGYITNIRAEHDTDVAEASDMYQRLRQDNYQQLLAAQAEQRQQDELLKKADKKISRLTKLHRKQTAQARREKRLAQLHKTKERLKVMRTKEQRLAEKRRVREERTKFWPKYVYAVRIQLEVDADLAAHGGHHHSQTCNLVLSYVTSDAYWAPSYDLQLSTESAAGTLCFDALLTNATSETWDKCKITLSTSQATSSSLADKAPELREWSIKRGSNGIPPLYSRDESNLRHKSKMMKDLSAKNGKANRDAMFGVPSAQGATDPAVLQDYQTQLMVLEQQNKKRSLMARQAHEAGDRARASVFHAPPPQATMARSSGGGLFGASRAAPPPAPAAAQPFGQAHSFGQAQPQQMMMQQQQQQQQQVGGRIDSHEPGLLEDFDFVAFENSGDLSAGEETPREDANLAFQNSLIEQTGFATVYELQGAKTLAPSSTSSKQRISTIELSGIKFTHTIVPKLKAAAYLTATIANTSRNILLQGPVGVTLDGGFMGRTTLPRCPGDGAELRLGLGVDHAVRVVYATPEVRRSGGVSYNEERKIYTRSVYVENTHSADSIRLIVKDQVPVSKDERVRVEVLHPDRLRADYDEGQQPKQQQLQEQPNLRQQLQHQQQQHDLPEVGEGGKKADEGQWGSAEVKMAKSGAVDWLVTLRKGRSVKLALSWLVATPLGEEAVQVD